MVGIVAIKMSSRILLNSRRIIVLTVIIALVSIIPSSKGSVTQTPIDIDGVVYFFRSLQTPGGGFVWYPKDTSASLVPTYCAIIALKTLGWEPAHKQEAVHWLCLLQKEDGTFSATDFSTGILSLHDSFWAVVGLHELGADIPNKERIISTIKRWQNESTIFPMWPSVYGSNLEATYNAIVILTILGEKISFKQGIIDWVESCQTDAGGFRDVKASQASVTDTHFAIMVLKALNSTVPNEKRTVDFLRSIQNWDGGFGYVLGQDSYISCTHSAILALNALGSNPNDQRGVIEWILACQNLDEGFGSEPGHSSYTSDTQLAIDSLKALGVPFFSNAEYLISHAKSIVDNVSDVLANSTIEACEELFLLATDQCSDANFSKAIDFADQALIISANSVINRADRAITRALEVGADVSGAYGHLEEATLHFATKDYYEAIMSAIKAEKAASEALTSQRLTMIISIPLLFGIGLSLVFSYSYFTRAKIATDNYEKFLTVQIPTQMRHRRVYTISCEIKNIWSFPRNLLIQIRKENIDSDYLPKPVPLNPDQFHQETIYIAPKRSRDKGKIRISIQSDKEKIVSTKLYHLEFKRSSLDLMKEATTIMMLIVTLFSILNFLGQTILSSAITSSISGIVTAVVYKLVMDIIYKRE